MTSSGDGGAGGVGVAGVGVCSVLVGDVGVSSDVAG